MNNHHCHATGCGIKIPPEMFLCRDHWMTLPSKYRDEIWKSYRPGQCDDKNPSKEYCLTAKKCIIYLANEEKIRPDTRLYDLFLLGDIDD